MANDILSYTSRDFKSIKEDLIDAIPALTGTWTSRDDGDPGIVLVKLMSALGDMLSFNSDKQALEYYGATVTQRKNAARLFNLVGYHMHWYRSAETQVTLTYRTPMPDWVYDYKRVIDLDSSSDDYENRVIEILNEYVSKYKYPHDSEMCIACPPRIDDNDNIPILPGMSERIETPLGLGTPSAQWFIDAATTTYDAWQNSNTIGVYTYLEDPHKTLGLYSSQSTAIPYMLIPSNIRPGVLDSRFMPQAVLKPYEPQSFQAIQGYLCTTTFTGAQLKKNRFYVPDSFLDEEHMWVSYTTITDNITQDVPIFLQKTDNLLTVNKFTDDYGNKIIYFQFGVDEFDYPYIELASYWSTMLSQDSVTFKFYFVKTRGSNGNITTNYLTRTDISSDIVVQNLSNTEYNVDSNGNVICIPGFNPETAREAFIASQNYIMTYDTLVTIYDFTRFLRRQGFVSNGFACDGQYADDINDKMALQVRNYSRDQLLSILGDNADKTASDIDLQNTLISLREVKSTPASVRPGSEGFEKYSLNLYPIINDYATYSYDSESTESYQTAVYSNVYGNTHYPYKLYRILTSDDPGVVEHNYKYAESISDSMQETRIVTALPKYAPCRVFEWRCCGTLHLTQSVSDTEADDIIRNVINTLKTVYSPKNVSFGEKITYMEIIDTITQSDPRIRYFDAGIGDKKLVEYANIDDPDITDTVYNMEAYFNAESIMRYVQDFDENKETLSPYYNMIIIDPSYLQSQNIPK